MNSHSFRRLQTMAASGLATFVLTALVLGLAGITRAEAQLPPVPFSEGERFPDVELEHLETGKRTPVLSLLEGKRTILHIFAAW